MQFTCLFCRYLFRGKAWNQTQVRGKTIGSVVGMRSEAVCVQLAMIQSSFCLSVDGLPAVSSKNQSHKKALRSCSFNEPGPFYNLANNRTMDPQQRAMCIAGFITILPSLRLSSLCRSISPGKNLSRAAGCDSGKALAACNPIGKGKRPA
jgi:hypothetical protein